MGGTSRKSRTGLACVIVLGAMATGFAAPAMAAKPSGIGVTSVVVRDVEGKTEEAIRQLVLRDSVYQNEIVQTGMESASELKFTDETRISVGPNSSIVLDEFVYDPDPGEGTFALQVTEGVFRFFSGNMASSNYKIETPTVTVGVRGTVLVLVTRGDGAVTVIMESDEGVEVTNNNGDTVVLETPGMATVTFLDGTMTPPGSPPEWALLRIQDMDNVLSTASLPTPPPIQERPEKPEPDIQTASVPLTPAETPEPTTTEPPKRGLPRAAYAQGEEEEPAGGFAHANDNALQPDPPNNGGAGSSSSGGNGPLILSGNDGGSSLEMEANTISSRSNNGGNNNGNGNGNSGNAGNGNGGGNGNGNGKGS